MRRERLDLLLGCLLAAVVAMTLFHRADPDAAISESMGERTTKDGTLLGYTKYKDYLSASKSVLGERTKFVGTTVHADARHRRRAGRRRPRQPDQRDPTDDPCQRRAPARRA